LPETPLVVVMGQQFTGVTMAYTTSVNGSGGWARAPFLPANSLRTPAQFDLDLRLTRSIPVTERIRVLLFGEAFNATNTQRDTSVQNIAYTATTGAIRAVPGVGNGTGSFAFPYGTQARRLQVGVRIVF
jgi:hypothetical protein